MSEFARNAAGVLLRDLAGLRRELEAYPDDESIWTLPAGLPNSAGTLALHLCGSLRFFIDAKLGGSDFVRDRPREFTDRGVSRAELLRQIGDAEAAIGRVLPHLSEQQLDEHFPEALYGHTYQVGDLLVHLCAHVAYHLGQVDYHRRIVTGQNAGVNAVPLTGIRTARPTES